MVRKTEFFLTIAHPLLQISQDTSSSHWLKFTHSRHQQETYALEMPPWTLSACHVNTCRATCHAKILSRAFTMEMLSSNCFVVTTKAGESTSLLLTSQLGAVLRENIRLMVKLANLKRCWSLLIKA